MPFCIAAAPAFCFRSEAIARTVRDLPAPGGPVNSIRSALNSAIRPSRSSLSRSSIFASWMRYAKRCSASICCGSITSPSPPAAIPHQASRRSRSLAASAPLTTLSAAQSCSAGFTLTPCTKPRNRSGIITFSANAGAGVAALARSSAERACHNASSPPAPAPSSPSKPSAEGSGSCNMRPGFSPFSSGSSAPPSPPPLLSPVDSRPSSSFPLSVAPDLAAASRLRLRLPRFSSSRLTFRISALFVRTSSRSSLTNCFTSARKSGFFRSYCSTIHFGTQAFSTGSTSISNMANVQSIFPERRTVSLSSDIPAAVFQRVSCRSTPVSKASYKSPTPKKRSNSEGSPPACIDGSRKSVLPSNRLFRSTPWVFARLCRSKVGIRRQNATTLRRA